MFSKLFGTKKKETFQRQLDTPTGANWAFLKTDIHSHLIPGIDDGAATPEDSISMILQLQEMGFEAVITTPHIKSDYYPNDSETILSGLEKLNNELCKRGIHMPVSAAAEYYVDERFMELLDKKDLLTVHKNEVLIEFSFVFEPMRLSEILFQIQAKGYKPILAHPERYNYYQKNPEIFQLLKERGCYLQLNALSMTGYYGKTVKETAERLLAGQLYDYCGSDMHHIRHAAAMHQFCGQKNFSQLYHYPFLNKEILK